jgi:hypothetical protein
MFQLLLLQPHQLPGLTSMGTKEMQQKLKTASRAGKAYMETGGRHRTHDDFFIAETLKQNEIEAEKLATIKKLRLEFKQRDVMAKALLEKNIEIWKLKSPY